MTILVTGATGQLGAELCRRMGPNAIGLGRNALDITDREAVTSCLDRWQPTAVINCAAFTQVDLAEQEAERCWQVNAHAVEHLAERCREADCTLVQISTDYVFGADTSRRIPYREDDRTGPLNVYGSSKLGGEHAAARCPRHVIVRSCGLFGVGTGGGRPGNFVERVLERAERGDALRMVADQECTPTSVAQLARSVEFLLGHEAQGVYHVTNAGHATWFEFAVEIVAQAGLHVDIQPTTTCEYRAAASRPSYSVLDVGKYHQLGGPPLSDWRTALAEYLARRRVDS